LRTDVGFTGVTAEAVLAKGGGWRSAPGVSIARHPGQTHPPAPIRN